MEVLLDTSFILTCLKEKLDFLQAEEYGKMILPVRVVSELIILSGKRKGKEKERAELALDIIHKNRDKFEMSDLDKGHVDAGIKHYVEKKKGKKIIVATMDSGLKKALKGKVKILTIRARKKFELM
jgi:rRNA-processing protein FCF1